MCDDTKKQLENQKYNFLMHVIDIRLTVIQSTYMRKWEFSLIGRAVIMPMKKYEIQILPSPL